MRFYLMCTLSLVVLLLVGADRGFAAGSGGFRVETPEAGAFGKGSAFVGEANTPGAVYYNPAGMNQIQTFEISAGGAYIAPQSNYKDTSGQETQMRRNAFLVPHVYAVAPLTSRLALGLGSSSYWGLGTEWANDSFSRYVATKSTITNIDSMIALSFKVTDQWSVAASADNDDSKVDLDKAVNNAGFAPDGYAKLKAKDNAWGFRLATLFKINDQNQVGLMYRSAVHHNYTGKIYIDGLGPAYLAAFASPYNFAGSSYSTKATEKLTLPQSLVMGYSFKPNKKWTINFDLEWVNWSQYKQDLINYPDETDAGRLAFLNTGNPVSRHWHSAFSEAIGAEYAMTETFRLRAGYYHHTHVVPQGTFSSSLPDANSHGFTGGFGYDFGRHLTLDLAYSGLLYEQRKVNNDVGAAVGANINGKYRQFTNIGMATLTYKY